MNHCALRNSLSSYYTQKTAPNLTPQAPPSGQGLFQDTCRHFFLHWKLCWIPPLFFNTPLACWLAIRFGDSGGAKLSHFTCLSQHIHNKTSQFMHPLCTLQSLISTSLNRAGTNYARKQEPEEQLRHNSFLFLPMQICFATQHSRALGDYPPFSASNNLSPSDPLIFSDLSPNNSTS